jgi:hypothetical protein
MVRRIAVLAVAALCFPVAACSIPGGGVGGPPGGTVSLSNYAYQGTDYASASAFFIARLDTSNGSTLDAFVDSWTFDVPMNECLIAEPPEEVLAPTPIGLDVGPTVTLTTEDGSQEVVLTQSGEGSYSASSFVPASGMDYTVALEGTADVESTTWEGALHLPESFSVDGLTSTLVLDNVNATELTWTSVGADFVLFVFPVFGTAGYCKVDDDGAFAIPPEFASEIDSSGYFTVGGYQTSKKRLSGRAVRVVGVSGQQAYYSVGATPSAN